MKKKKFPDFVQMGDDPYTEHNIIVRHMDDGEYYCDNGHWTVHTAIGDDGVHRVNEPSETVMHRSHGLILTPRTYAQYAECAGPYKLSKSRCKGEREAYIPFNPDAEDDEAPF